MAVTTRRKKGNEEANEHQQHEENAAIQGEDATRHASCTRRVDDALIDSIADIFEHVSSKNLHKQQQQQQKEPQQLVWKPEISLPQSKQEEGKVVSGTLEKHGNSYQVLKNLVVNKNKKTKKSASKEWFELPAQEITEDVKTELRVLRLRSAFDPKQFYKKFDDTKFPSNFQFGRVVESSADYYSSRMTKKERKRTMAEEIMSDPHLAQVRKKRFTAIQEKAGYWNTKQPSLVGGRRTHTNPRMKKKPRRAKHS